nr:MAG TPA: hypothetical protein [Caudoviricetes sp.]
MYHVFRDMSIMFLVIISNYFDDIFIIIVSFSDS